MILQTEGNEVDKLCREYELVSSK